MSVTHSLGRRSREIQPANFPTAVISRLYRKTNLKIYTQTRTHTCTQRRGDGATPKALADATMAAPGHLCQTDHFFLCVCASTKVNLHNGRAPFTWPHALRLRLWRLRRRRRASESFDRFFLWVCVWCAALWQCVCMFASVF